MFANRSTQTMKLPGHMQTCRVEVDCRNAALDRRVPIDVVKDKHQKGELHFDVTNKMYCVPQNGVLPLWLMAFPHWN